MRSVVVGRRIGLGIVAAAAVAQAACGDDGGAAADARGADAAADAAAADAAPAELCAPPVVASGPAIDLAGPMCRSLSTYQLFTDLPAMVSDPALVAFDLNTALYSDYASKLRYLYVPPGSTAAWADPGPLDLPVGSVLVKTFLYPADRRDPDGARRLLETRLLIHRADGWDAAAYVWNEAQTDATLAIAGAVLDASWIHDDGSARTNQYVVPNKNQCSNCHDDDGAGVRPLGPRVRHLNRDAPGGGPNQLADLIERGVLTGAPADPASWPRAAVFDDPADDLDARARAYLDIGCAHCHNPAGAARTSGLDLREAQLTPAAFGVCKAPVATGQASGGRQYDIVPGNPDRSILIYRLEATEAAIKMPELGRNLVHAEGVALLRDWITAMPGGCVDP